MDASLLYRQIAVMPLANISRRANAGTDAARLEKTTQRG